jgi:putative glutamine amidotransferase
LRPGRSARTNDLRGLIIGGGADIDPELYGEKPTLSELTTAAEEDVKHRRTPRLTLLVAPMIYLGRRLFSLGRGAGGADPERDAFERQMFTMAMDRGIPILGICRGAQLLNVLLGGDIHQDIESFYTEPTQTRTVLPRKRILLSPTSRLARILGTVDTNVNALHHQAIRELGRSLRAVAREDSGVIQAVEHTSHPFLIGVQWHPEYLPQHRRQRALFEAMVAAARGWS